MTLITQIYTDFLSVKISQICVISACLSGRQVLLFLRVSTALPNEITVNDGDKAVRVINNKSLFTNKCRERNIMALQNLVSAVLTPEKKAGVLEKALGIKSDLNFVISLPPSEKKDYVKVGNTFIPFIDKAYNIILQHPEIMPGTFNLEEFKHDYLLGKDLGEILGVLHEITLSVEDTYYAVNSDSMVESLEVYAAVQNNVNKVPGMDSTAADMKTFFKKSKKVKTDPNAGQNQ